MKSNKFIILLICLILLSLGSCYATSNNTDIISSDGTDDLSIQSNINTNEKSNNEYIFIDEDSTYPKIDTDKYDTTYEENDNIETSQASIQNVNEQKIVYVDANTGSDENNGDESNPYKTLQKAVTSIENNSIINMKNGEYILDQQIVISKSLTINGENNQQTIINCNNNVGFNITNTKLTFDNLKFINANQNDDASYPGVIMARSNVILLINNCIFFR